MISKEQLADDIKRVAPYHKGCDYYSSWSFFKADARPESRSAGCHGSIKYVGKEDEVLYVSLAQADYFTIGRLGIRAAQKYWSEITPHFRHVLYSEYMVGDKYVLLDTNKAGNETIMACIALRQPWEDNRFLEHYFEFRKKFTPIVSLFCTMFYVRKGGTATVRSAVGLEPDVFSSRADLKNLIHFQDTGELEFYSDPLKEGVKDGVFLGLQGIRSSELLNASDTSSLNGTSRIRRAKGAFGRLVNIGSESKSSKDLFEEIIVSKFKSLSIPEEKYRCVA